MAEEDCRRPELAERVVGLEQAAELVVVEVGERVAARASVAEVHLHWLLALGTLLHMRISPSCRLIHYRLYKLCRSYCT